MNLQILRFLYLKCFKGVIFTVICKTYYYLFEKRGRAWANT